MSLYKQAIRINEIPRLRVGLKWESLDRDYLKFTGDLPDSAQLGRARLKVAAAGGISCVYGFGSHLLRRLDVLPEVLKNAEGKKKNIDEFIAAQKKIAKKISEEKDLPSYNLDLLCFCYDGQKKLVETVSPLSDVPRNPSQAQLSILHSGDDEDGVGVGFDEEVLINLKDIAANIQHIFFVIFSENHDFNQLKGGSCSIISTKNEKLLLNKELAHHGKQESYIFAKLQRSNDGWSLEEISDYIKIDEDPDSALDDTLDDILRNKYLK